MEPIDLADHGMDLSRHGIVEAHAGTGKTWTIVHRIVLPLLKGERPDRTWAEQGRSQRLHVRDLLVVTYTDKAAGELRARIRDGLEKALRDCRDPQLASHLDDCRKCLGEAWIGTIHATSLRLLRAFPFESAMPFSAQLVDDPEGLEETLAALLRTDDGPWFSRPPQARAALASAGMETLREEALCLATRLMDPSAAVDLPDAAVCALNLDLAGKAMDEPAGNLVRHVLTTLVPRLEAISVAAGARKAKNLLKKWKDLDPDAPPRSLWGFSSLKSKAPDLSREDAGEAAVLDLWEEVAARWARSLDPLAEEFAYWEKMGALPPESRLKAEFVRDWAAGAVARWRDDKRRRGLLSYADMLGRLREALDDARFRAELRSRIRVGIVDEFQDTGRESWEIFRRWFEPSPAGVENGILFLVGDPKQSIYSFQGADIQNYRSACDHLQAAGGKRYVLRRNFRSLPEVVDGINELLVGNEPWFGSGIRYEEADRSLAVERPSVDGSAPFGQRPVRVARVSGSARSARSLWAREVARAVLAWKGRTVRLPHGGDWSTPRALDWGDFAVVVRGRTHAADFADAFGKAGIPWALYKQAGVFSSRAAREWTVVLEALAEDGDAMLRLCAITRVFGIDVGSFDPAVHLDPVGPVAGLFLHWRNLSERGRWAELLESVLRDSGWEERILSGPDADRQWMDCRQVRSWIQQALRSGEGSEAQIARRLRRLADGDDADARDANLLQRATDRERVQILTMHASKGLEFPVVFLGQADSGVVRGSRKAWSWIAPGGLRVGASFLPAPPAVRRQRESEERRLLYVALTRSQLSCSVAHFSDSKGQARDVLSRILENREQEGRALAAWEDPGEGSDPREARDGGQLTGSVVSRDALAALRLGSRAVRQASFTALVRGIGSHTLEGRLGRSEEEAPSEEEENSVDSWLPKGAKTGDALHEILELLLAPKADVSWILLERSAPDPVVLAAKAILRRHGLGEVPVDPVLSLLRQVLSTPIPLPDGSGSVRIAEIPTRDRRCEVEFHRAIDRRGLPVMPHSPTTAWVVGHIDLLFRHNDVWYVADWKSNALRSWSQSALEESVRSHAYDLQARLYAHAVRDAMPGEIFGGCLWIYLRGFAGGGKPVVWSKTMGESEDFVVERALADWLRPAQGSAA
jgi:exodeoxyribonuclease V beta subunit